MFLYMFMALDIIHSGESMSVKNEVKMPVQGKIGISLAIYEYERTSEAYV